MKIRKIVTLMLVAVLLAPMGAYASKSKWTSWWRPNDWYSKISKLNKKQRSTTVTGVVDTIVGKTITFKTTDGQKLLLLGNKAVAVGKVRGAKIRVFGNIQKPSSRYPEGAIHVRNFKVLEKLTPIAKPAKVNTSVSQVANNSEPEPYLEPEPVAEPTPEPVAEPTPEPTPEPVAEPVANTTQEPVADATPEPYSEPSPAAVPANDPAPVVDSTPAVVAKGYTDYVVESGDTLGKISKKMYGTTAKWKQIAEYNNLTDPRLLRVGKTIRIPKQ